MTEPVGVEQTANGRKEMARTGGAGRVVGRLRVVRRSAWRDAASWTPFLSIVAVYSLGSLLLGPLLGWRGLILPETLTLITAIFGAVLVCVAVAVLWAFSTTRALREGRGFAALWHGARMIRGDVASVTLRVVVVVGCAMLLVSVFTSWRVAIPTIHPFAWDAMFDRWDIALHGVRPWISAHALLDHPWARGWLPWLVDVAYSRGWYLANIGVVVVLCAGPVGPRGQRVLIAYVLQYAVLGSFLATLMSSAGPVSTAGSSAWTPTPRSWSPYRRGSGLMSFSAPSGLRSICGANTWPAHSTSRPGSPRSRRFMFRRSTLLALALWLWRRWAGVLGWLMVAVTLFGSVALGWHYAVDGYAALVGMLALWWVAGRIVWRGGAPDV